MIEKKLTDQEYQSIINRIAFLEADNKNKQAKIKQLESYIDSEIRKMKTEIRSVKTQSNNNKTSIGSLKSEVSRLR